MPKYPVRRSPLRVRILDWDVENRPSTYWYEGQTTAEITAIACCWAHDSSSMKCWLLGKDKPQKMLKEFVKRYDEADMVTGHHVRRHDLPLVNAALIEYGMEPLSPKVVCDTKNDLIGFKDMSKSQENLAAMFGIEAPKVQMNQVKWREANRLTKPGLVLTAERVCGDVNQHMALRLELVRRGLLNPPRVWEG